MYSRVIFAVKRRVGSLIGSVQSQFRIVLPDPDGCAAAHKTKEGRGRVVPY